MLTLLLATGLSNAQESDLIDEAASAFNVPTFSSHQLVVQGQDLFKVAGNQDGTDSIDGQVALIYNLASQTPTETLTLGGAVSGYLTTGGTHLIDVAAESVIAVNRQQYHNGTAGFFSAQRGAFGTGKAGEGDAIADMSFGGGVGYGRIFDVRTLVQAKTMFDVLEKSYSADQLREVAELIGRRGEYTQKYKLDADIYFYKDIAKALGGASTDQVYKVQQVLDSPLYNFSSLYRGWQVGADLDFGLGNMVYQDSFGVSSKIGIASAFAVMLGDSSLLIPIGISCLILDDANQQLTTPLSGGQCTGPDASFTLALSSSLGLNHSPSWNTTISAGIEQTYGSGEFEMLSIPVSPITGELEIESNAAMGADLVWTNGLTTSAAIGDELTYEWEITSTITYFIF